MGRHPWKPTVVPGPHHLLHFFLLLIALLSSLPVINCRSTTDDLYSVPLDPDEVEDSYFDEEEEVPQLSAEDIEKLKTRILEGLGLTKIPDVSKMNVSQEEYERMYNLYLTNVDEKRRQRSGHEALEQEEDGLNISHRFYSFPHADNMSTKVRRGHSFRSTRHRHETSIFLYFPVNIPETKHGLIHEVDHATLRLFVSGLHPDEAARRGNTVEVRVFQIVESDRLLVDQRRIHLASVDSKWTEFDLTRTVESWLRGDSSNMGIEVECLECSRRGLTLVTPQTQGSNSSVSPVLNVLVEVNEGSVRDKRSTDLDSIDSLRENKHTQCRKPRQRCCRHTMEVIFKDIGFNFIKQPKSFDAGYCIGRCPPRFKPAHEHALIQSLLFKQKRAPRPCCAPSKLEMLEILYADDNSADKLKLKQWNDVRVLECACS